MLKFLVTGAAGQLGKDVVRELENRGYEVTGSGSKKRKTAGRYVKMDIIILWLKVLVACIPAIVIGMPFNDLFEKWFYNYPCVAIALIVFGIAFIIVENNHKGKPAKINSMDELTYKTAFLIGLFQLIAAIFPGTSRSGATIVGALILGVSRTVAAEFTFVLAIPVMFGASFLKIVKFFIQGGGFSFAEFIYLVLGMVVAFGVSVYSIKFLMGYVRKHDFKFFGYYRIVLGIVVLSYFGISALVG